MKPLNMSKVWEHVIMRRSRDCTEWAWRQRAEWATYKHRPSDGVPGLSHLVSVAPVVAVRKAMPEVYGGWR